MMLSVKKTGGRRVKMVSIKSALDVHRSVSYGGRPNRKLPARRSGIYEMAG